MTRVSRILIIALLQFMVGGLAWAQFPAPCDTRKECIGQGVSLTVNSGRNAHFLELSRNPIRPRQTAMTIEMWVRVDRQAGQRQYLAGLWGPNSDFNDVFVLYIDQSDRLTFEVNGDAGTLQSIDNTIATTSATPLYTGWHHIAATFDGTTTAVEIYVDGLLAAGPVTNPTYPARYLKPLDRGDLPLLIGSFNGVADNQNLYRTLKGMVDEVRIWDRALTAQQIRCQKDLSLEGNESGLRAYLRCNEPADNIIQVCDATGNGHTGLLRSGASNQRSNRVPPRNLMISPTSLTETIRCDSTKTWTFTVTDTSFCGSTARALIRGQTGGFWSVTPVNLTLAPGVPVTVTLTFRGTNVGPFTDSLEIRPSNRCGTPSTFVKLAMNRITEVAISRSSILYDTLYVGCKDVTYLDSTITICNSSDSLFTPRNLTINNIRSREPLGYRAMGINFPLVLTPGQCTTIVIRCLVRDTTANYPDTLEIISDDRCQRTPIRIALLGRSQEVISVRTSDGSRRVDTMRFEPTCPGLLSTPRDYTWQNLTLSPLTIDTVTVPRDFTHYRLRFPLTLLPATGYQPNAVRFLPRQPGNVFDSIIIRTKIQGCLVEKKIYVTGRGLDNKVQWSANGLVDFGNVIVGQQRTINVRAKNNSKFDALNVALYVERGQSFALLAGTGRTIAPGDSTVIPVTFRPLDSLTYFDKLCLFETRCYTVDCIDLRGKGVFEKFQYNPLVLKTEAVLACGTRKDSIYIVNKTSTDQRIDSMVFVDQSGGRMTILEPPLPWVNKSATILFRDSLKIVTQYTPNDLTRDRADRAYVRFRSTDRAEWQVQLIGSSATPKLFVTQNTAFGTVEVSDIRSAQLIVENTSSIPVRLDSLSIGAGFTIVGTSRPLPLILNPRDSIRVDVEFRPTAARTYTADLVAWSNDPCIIRGSGGLTGRGVIIQLESALSLVNFGYVRPCDCVGRTIELLNASQVFGMTVDKIVIDSTGVPGGKPQYFTWRSKYSPDGTLPYTIPAGERDTMVITFCPRTPAETALIECRASLRISAKGPQWSRTIETFLIGKRSLTFRPTPTQVQFPYGVIDQVSPSTLSVVLKIPDFTVNPSQDRVVIDSITLDPNERVFFIQAPVTFPRIINPGDSLIIQLRQRPRAPRDYRARLRIWYSEPCVGWDTTVLVRGGGFAQTRGLQFSYDPLRSLPDTFAMISCDTLVVPLYSSISIDASVVDIAMRVDFDSTQLRLLDVSSPLTNRTCRSATGGVSFTPSLSVTPSPYGGQAVTLKNFCGIDSTAPFAALRFVTVANNRANSRLTVDSINFDTEDVILYKLIATGDRGTILALKSDIQIRVPTAFDSVRILDCAERTIVIYNTGDLGNTLDQLLDLPVYTSIVSTVPALGDSVVPGDSAVVTLRFCPRSERFIDSSVIAVSLSPCEVRDTTAVTGYGYAPELDVAMLPTRTFFVPDSIKGQIGDTITVPVMIDRDVSATYGGITYWLNGLNFDIDVVYEPRSLKFVDASFLAKPNATTINPALGQVNLAIRGADSVASGTVADLRFLVTVPEYQITDLSLTTQGFISDSLQFLDVVPTGGGAPVEATGRCNITVVRFSTVGAPRIGITPQPAREEATISFRMQETVPVTLDLVDARGTVVATLLDGSLTLGGGEYAVRVSTSEFANGAYVVRINAGVFTSYVPFIIAK